MSVTLTREEQVDEYTWLFEWQSTLSDPTYYIYVDGLLALITQEESFQLDVGEGFAAFQVFDSSSDVPADVLPGRAVLSWPTAAGNATYYVEEYVDSEWVLRATLKSTSERVLSFVSRFLEDDQTHQFRLRPADTASGIDGTIRAISFFMVRPPDSPEVSYSVDTGTGVVTIT